MAIFNSDIKTDSIVSDNYDNQIENPSNICNTTACETAGKLIRDAINASVDPCDDFYEFACGGWMASHTIPKDKYRYGNFDELSEKLQNSLRKELSEPKKEDSDAVVYAAELYKACTDEGINF
jgi:predicted metalloendopeptidase